MALLFCLSMKLFIFIFCSIVCVQGRAQADRFQKDSARLENLKFTSIALEYPSSLLDSGTLSFSDIVCLDARLDTTCIGVLGQSFKRIVLAPSIPVALSDYFNGALKEQARLGNDSLLCVIKRLRVMVSDSLSFSPTIHKEIYKVSAEVECYLKNNGRFFPAFRIDTSYFIPEVEIKEIPELLKPFTDRFLAKCFKINRSNIFKRNSYSPADITARYDARKQLYKRGLSPAKGLYANVKEFRDNTPSVSDFQVLYKKGQFAFSMPDNSAINYKRVLIYCDGNKAWIRTPEGYVPLIKKDLRYEYIGNEESSKRNGNHLRYPTQNEINTYGTAGAVLVSGLTSKIQPEFEKPKKKVHFLDIETGEMY